MYKPSPSHQQFLDILTEKNRPKKTANLMDEYLGDQREYQKAVDDGFQGTYEEFLRMKSMRETAAQGGVIGKGGMFRGEELPNNREGFKLIADRASIKGPLTRGAYKDQYSVRVKDDTTGDRFQKYFKDETKFNKFIETNSPKEFISADDLRVIANNLKKTLGTVPTQTQVANEAGISTQAVIKRLTEGVDYSKLTPQEAGK